MYTLPKLWLVVLYVVLIVGCSYVERKPAIYIEPKGYYNKAYQYGEWADGNRSRLAVYRGKSKQDILTDFGKPSYIATNAILHRKTYDEEWVYYYTRGIPLINQNSWTCNFYFIDDVVVEISVM